MKRMMITVAATSLWLSGVALGQETDPATDNGELLPTLVLPSCPEAQFNQEERKCFPVTLVTQGAKVASVGFTVEYPLASLTLPGGATDVLKGAALNGNQSLVAVVTPKPTDGVGTVQVTITPPFTIPIPTIADGEVVQICFTAPTGAPDSCAVLTVLKADMGDDSGKDIPVAMPGDGGIQVGNPPVTFVPDHYQCYQTKLSKGSAFESRPVFLIDQFEQRQTTVVKPEALCNPADKLEDGELIFDRDTHLAGYQIQEAKVCSDTGNLCVNAKDCNKGAKCAAPKHQSRTALINNQFGKLLVSTQPAKRLLVPSTKNLPALEAVAAVAVSEVDHFKCYGVKVNKRCEGEPIQACKKDADCGSSGPCSTGFAKGLQATVTDQFTQSKLFDLQKPMRLCTPVNKNNEGYKHPENHLMCYQVKVAKGQAAHSKQVNVAVSNQFGTVLLDTVKEEELCVPSEKTLIDADG